MYESCECLDRKFLQRRKLFSLGIQFAWKMAIFKRLKVIFLDQVGSYKFAMWLTFWWTVPLWFPFCLMANGIK